MKILITGNSGYIGSHLTQMLNKEKTLSLYGIDKNQPIVTINSFYNENIIDTDFSNLKNIEFDAVIHLAAEVSVSESVLNSILYYKTNTLGTLNLLENVKTKNFICASTGAAEGMLSPYGISKRAMENIVTQYCTDYKIPFTIFRFYNVIGQDGIIPKNPDGLFFNLIKAIETKNFNLYGNNYNTKDGTCIRDYVHVNEICNALRKAIYESTNSIENLGHGEGYTVKEIIDIFKKVNNVDFDVTVCPKRDGDLEKSVLKNPSRFMEKIYSINELLRV